MAVMQSQKIRILKISAEDIESDPSILKKVHGVLIPGGFGSRGIEGKIVLLNMLVKIIFRSLEYVWVYNVLLLNLVETYVI